MVMKDGNGVGALRVLQGEHAIFFPDIGNGREPSALYVLALSTSLFGRTLLAMHLPTALGSAGMVFATFWIGRLFFGRDEESVRDTPWRGLLIGGVGCRSDGGFPQPNDSGPYSVQQNYPYATASLLVSWAAMVGLERAKLVADWLGGRVRRAIAVHIYGGAFRALSDCFYLG